MFATVDVGGTKIKVAVFGDTNFESILDVKDFETSGYDKDISNILSVISDYQIEHLVMSIAGFVVDDKSGEVKDASNIPSWNRKNIKADIRKELDIKNINLLHDIKGHAMSEIAYSDIREDYCYIGWGTGIGASYVRFIDKVISFQHIEFGFQLIEESSGLDYIKEGFLETFIGGKAIQERYGKRAENLNEKEWGDVIEKLGHGLSNFFSLNYPKLIVWGGSIAVNQPEVVKKSMETASRIIFYWPMPKFQFSKFKENAGIYGGLGYIKLTNEGYKIH